MTPHPARRVLVAAFAVALAGCDALLPVEPPPPLGEAPEICGYPPGTELAFVGFSSLKRLGINDEDVAVGEFYITADPIKTSHYNFEPSRAYCVVLKDGHAEGGRLPDYWTHPQLP